MNRLLHFRLAIVLPCLLLTARLGQLQVVHGGHFRALAENNRMRLIPEQSPRGLIVDRAGKVLASNQRVFRVAIVPQDAEDLPGLLSYLSRMSGEPVAALERRLKLERTLAFMPATVLPKVPRELALRLEEERWRWPGLLVRTETARRYPMGTAASHLLGYLSQPTDEELPLLKPYGVRPKYLIGRSGIERLLDHDLRGMPGGTMVEVNHRGRQVRLVSQRRPQVGERVALTVDAPLQSLIDAAFGEAQGACVVLDPWTGAVRAMVSRPAFDPEVFALSDSDTVRQLLSDPRRALVNRATMGRYPPGSVMKLVTALAALESGAVTPDTVVDCTGALKIGDREIHCWKRDGHGPVTLWQALMHSCNVYFMQVGRRVGAEALLQRMDELGFGQPTGWVLEEKAGHLPTRRLTAGEVAMLSIGQTELLVTPMQVAIMAAAIANGGVLVQPWVIERVGDTTYAPPEPRDRLHVDPGALQTIRSGMFAVVHNPAGTGRRAFSPSVQIAAKTGTAQTHVEGKTHGWFAGYCPVDQPRVAVSIIWEFGGSGGDLPAEIARAVCEYVALEGAGSTQQGSDAAVAPAARPL